MPRLQARVRAEKTQDVIPGKFLLDVVVANAADAPARVNMHQASHPALVLDLRDGKDEPVLLPAPSAPDESDLAPGEEIAPGEAIPPSGHGVPCFGADRVMRRWPHLLASASLISAETAALRRRSYAAGVWSRQGRCQGEPVWVRATR